MEQWAAMQISRRAAFFRTSCLGVDHDVQAIDTMTLVWIAIAVR